MKLDVNSLNNPIKIWYIAKNRISTDENQMAEKCLKQCWTLALREIHIKTTLRYQLIPARMDKINKTNDIVCS